jgi:hypothetical protein
MPLEGTLVLRHLYSMLEIKDKETSAFKALKILSEYPGQEYL